jgi:hypothetical protein
MAKTDKEPRASSESRTKAEQGHKLSKELEMTFPASDPPASAQPGAGVTGPVITKK